MNPPDGQLRFLYFAPSDIQVARVDRQCIVQFCDALYRLEADVELIAMKIKTSSFEDASAGPLDSYRTDGFPTRLISSLAGQDSARWWVGVNRLQAHARAASSLLRLNRARASVFYTKNYSSALMLVAMRVACRIHNALVVFEVHVPPANALQRFVLNRADCVVANSMRLAERLRSSEVETKVVSVHQGVDLEAIDEARVPTRDARLRTNLPLNKKLVVYTGKVYRGYEEIDFILEAARRLRANNEILFVIVGGRRDHVQSLAQRSAEAGDHNVMFVPFVAPRRVTLFQLAADALLTYYPSSVSTVEYMSPGKLFEYMACAKPIIAADHPVLLEILGDPPAAVLVEPDNPIALAAAITETLTDREAAARLGAVARERVARFSWSQRARCILEACEAALAAQ